jgi:hypothetical protein
MLPSTVLDRLIGVLEFYDRDRLDITTMRMTMAPIAVDISNMSGNSGGSVLVVGVVVPVSSVVVEGVEVVESFHPASMAISHRTTFLFAACVGRVSSLIPIEVFMFQRNIVDDLAHSVLVRVLHTVAPAVQVSEIKEDLVVISAVLTDLLVPQPAIVTTASVGLSIAGHVDKGYA